MKNASVFFLLFLVAVSLFAQQRTGIVTGKVIDGEGKPVSGATLTLTGSATLPVRTTTDDGGGFRFMTLLPAEDYALKTEHQDFKTAVRQNIHVALGGRVDVVVRMEPGPPEETVVATDPLPVVDKRKGTVGLNMPRTLLQSLPTARDPWEIMRMAPAVVVTQDNVGGIFTGEMPSALARAANEGDNIWAHDGLVVSDPEVTGKPATHWDFDSFEEMNVSSGIGDVSQQTGGIQINVVSRRGGSKISFGGRFHYIDSRFQADTYSDKLASEGLPGINKFDEFKDFGFNIGLPVLKDKAWFWGSYGIQDLEAFTVYGNPDNALLSTAASKVNLNLFPGNRMEFYAQGNRKLKKGRDQWYGNPEGMLERSGLHFGYPVFSVQDEQTFGDSFSLSLRWGASNGGYELTPVMDPDRAAIAVFDERANRYFGSYYFYDIDKWSFTYNFQTVFLNQGLLGANHEFRLGFELSDRDDQKSQSGTPGNILITQNFNTPQADFNGDGEPDIPEDPNFRSFYFERGGTRWQGVKAWSAFFSDAVSFGRFNLQLGLRYDYQHPLTRTFTASAVRSDLPQWSTANISTECREKLNLLLPGASVPGLSATSTDGAKYAWKDFQPRLSLTYDVFGDGRTIAKLGYARYSSWMGNAEASRWSRGASGWLGFYWQDDDEEGILSSSELFWYTAADYALYPVFDNSTFVGDWEDAGGVFWGGFDYTNPSALPILTYSTQPDAQSQHTDEIFFALEREIKPDFGVQVSATFRRIKDFSWDLKYFPGTGVIQNPDWFEEAYSVPADVPGLGSTGEASGKMWYTLTAEATEYSPWYNKTPRPDYHEDYWGVDLVFTKRLRDNWMLNGSLTLQDSSRRYGENGLWDQTNRWATEGRPTSPYFVNFMAKLNGLYQFPLGIAASFTYEGRQGWIMTETFRIVDYTLPNPLSNSATLLMSPFGTDRLPFVHKINFRLEKTFKLGEDGRITAMVDVFNALNRATPLSRLDNFRGTYYIYEDPEENTWVPNPTANRLSQILNPRVFRLGVRFQF